MTPKYTIGILIAAIVALAAIQTGIFPQNTDISQDSFYDNYQRWKSAHGITFQHQQDIYRFQVFKNNLIQIELHNINPQRTYDLGINMFAHLTNQQFAQKYLVTALQSDNLRTHKSSPNKLEILEDVDWDVLGKVSPVKNQGTCDAGYAFCSVSLAQTRLLIKGQKIILSEQQVVDCSADYTTFGCSSGSRAGTLKFAKEKGLVQQASYPYVGVKGTCKNATGDYKIDFDILESNGCEQIKNNLYKTPMTIAVNAQTWQLYKSGIYNGCTSTQVNHDVYLVGVTTQSWRVKNSWGVRWGEYGYIRLALGDTCGICQKTGFGIKG